MISVSHFLFLNVMMEFIRHRAMALSRMTIVSGESNDYRRTFNVTKDPVASEGRRAIESVRRKVDRAEIVKVCHVVVFPVKVDREENSIVRQFKVPRHVEHDRIRARVRALFGRNKREVNVSRVHVFRVNGARVLLICKMVEDNKDFRAQGNVSFNVTQWYRILGVCIVRYFKV